MIGMREFISQDIILYGLPYTIAAYMVAVIFFGGFGIICSIVFFCLPCHPLFVFLVGLVQIWLALTYGTLLYRAICIAKHKKDLTKMSGSLCEIAMMRKENES
jgi:hypothetical protein